MDRRLGFNRRDLSADARRFESITEASVDDCPPGRMGPVSPEDMADAARILEALADEIDDGAIAANVRDARYLRGAAAGLRSAATE